MRSLCFENSFLGIFKHFYISLFDVDHLFPYQE